MITKSIFDDIVYKILISNTDVMKQYLYNKLTVSKLLKQFIIVEGELIDDINDIIDIDISIFNNPLFGDYMMEQFIKNCFNEIRIFINNNFNKTLKFRYSSENAIVILNTEFSYINNIIEIKDFIAENVEEYKKLIDDLNNIINNKYKIKDIKLRREKLEEYHRLLSIGYSYETQIGYNKGFLLGCKNGNLKLENKIKNLTEEMYSAYKSADIIYKEIYGKSQYD